MNRISGSVGQRLFALWFLFLLIALGDVSAQTSSLTLGWDPNVESELRGYVVYVGTQPQTYTETHDVGLNTTFTLTGAVPGQQYYFAVAAYGVAGESSPLSAEISAVAGGLRGNAVGLSSATSPASPDASLAERGGVRSLADAGRHGVLFVHQGREIRVMEGGGSASMVLLGARAGVEFLSVVIDPAFERSRCVFVAEARTTPGSQRLMTIARYRLAGAALGERAALVQDVQVPVDAESPFTVDGKGRIYVAVPSGTTGTDNPYAGKVLRFSAEGGVPRENSNASPIFAHGYARPTGLVLDPASERLWLAGAGAGWQLPVASVPVNAQPTQWPSIPAGLEASADLGTGTPVLALLVLPGATLGTPTSLLLAAGEQIKQVDLNRGTVTDTWNTSGYGVPRSLAASGSLLYVAFEHAVSGSKPTSSIQVFRVP